MSNVIDTSCLFSQVNEADVTIEPATAEYHTSKGYTHRVLHNGSLIWVAKSADEAMERALNFIETGV